MILLTFTFCMAIYPTFVVLAPFVVLGEVVTCTVVAR